MRKACSPSSMFIRITPISCSCMISLSILSNHYWRSPIDWISPAYGVNVRRQENYHDDTPMPHCRVRLLHNPYRFDPIWPLYSHPIYAQKAHKAGRHILRPDNKWHETSREYLQLYDPSNKL